MEERHRLSLIIATLGPSTDDEQELKIMIIAGIARQWTDGVDIARVLHSDGESITKERIKKFKAESEKRKRKTFIYLDTDDAKNFSDYLTFAKDIQPDYISIFKKNGLEKIKEAKSSGFTKSKIGVRLKKDDETNDIEDFLKEADFVMFEIDSKKIADEKLFIRSSIFFWLRIAISICNIWAALIFDFSIFPSLLKTITPDESLDRIVSR